MRDRATLYLSQLTGSAEEAVQPQWDVPAKNLEASLRAYLQNGATQAFDLVRLTPSPQCKTHVSTTLCDLQVCRRCQGGSICQKPCITALVLENSMLLATPNPIVTKGPNLLMSAQQFSLKVLAMCVACNLSGMHIIKLSRLDQLRRTTDQIIQRSDKLQIT